MNIGTDRLPEQVPPDVSLDTPEYIKLALAPKFIRAVANGLGDSPGGGGSWLIDRDLWDYSNTIRQMQFAVAVLEYTRESCSMLQERIASNNDKSSQVLPQGRLSSPADDIASGHGSGPSVEPPAESRTLPPSSIYDLIRARIQDDYSAAYDCLALNLEEVDGTWSAVGIGVNGLTPNGKVRHVAQVVLSSFRQDVPIANHIARQDPGTVMRVCMALREITDLCEKKKDHSELSPFATRVIESLTAAYSLEDTNGNGESGVSDD